MLLPDEVEGTAVAVRVVGAGTSKPDGGSDIIDIEGKVSSYFMAAVLNCASYRDRREVLENGSN